MKVYIDIRDQRWKKYKIDFLKIASMTYFAVLPSAQRFWDGIRFTRPVLNEHDAEVSIILTNDTEIKKLNKKYRGKNKATNVLSFETGDPQLLGDIYISFDTVMRESYELGVMSDELTHNFTERTAHMVVHGVLHLMGYDHLDDKSGDAMEKLESKIMKKLGYKDPYSKQVPNSSSAGEPSGVASSSPFRAPVGGKPTTNHEPRTRLLWLKLLLCGLIASFGFAPFNLWPLTIAGLGAAYLLAPVDGKFWKSYGRGFWFGAGYAAAMFWWVLHSIFIDAEMAARFWPFALPGLIGIALGGGAVFGLPFAIAGKFDKYKPLIFASSWASVLYLREFVLTGFPWNPLSNIMMPFPVIANSMALWGAIGLTFLIAFATASVAESIRRKKVLWGQKIAIVLMSALGLYYGAANIRLLNPDCIKEHVAACDRVRPTIKLMQPAGSQFEKLDEQFADEKLQKFTELSRSGEDADIIIWPETSHPFYIMSAEFPTAAELNKDMIVGAMSYARGNYFNSMIIAAPSGKIEQLYSKSHLVPFGEYSPMPWLVQTLGNLTPGAGPEVFQIGDFKFAAAICYEIIFSDSLVPINEKVHAVINITNDTWFGRTPGPYQHLDMARRYAIESGLPVIRANYSGISAFINADGRVVKQLPIGESGVLVGKPGFARMTSYHEIGRDFWGLAMIVILLAGISIQIFARQRKD